MKIYTKGGDKGETSLFGGKRLPKSHLRIEAYGTVDELNAHIGYLTELISHEESRAILIATQSKLFSVGSQLAADPDKTHKLPEVTAADISMLEQEIDRMETELPQLKSFILPSGHAHGAYCHIARTVCRRAERRVVALQQDSHVDENIIVYLNRLSDYLFVLARYLTMKGGGSEVPWRPNS